MAVDVSNLTSNNIGKFSYADITELLSVSKPVDRARFLSKLTSDHIKKLTSFEIASLLSTLEPVEKTIFLSKMSPEQKKKIRNDYAVDQAYARHLQEYHRAVNEYEKTGPQTNTYKTITGPNGKTRRVKTGSVIHTPPILFNKGTLRKLVTGDTTWHPENYGYGAATENKHRRRRYEAVNENDPFNLTLDKELNYPRQWLVKKLGLKHSSEVPNNNTNNLTYSPETKAKIKNLEQKIQTLLEEHLKNIEKSHTMTNEKEKKQFLDLANYTYEEERNAFEKELENAKQRYWRKPSMNEPLNKLTRKIKTKLTNWLTTEPAKPRRYTKEGREILTRNEVKQELGFDPNVSYEFAGFEAVKNKPFYQPYNTGQQVWMPQTGDYESPWSNPNYWGVAKRNTLSPAAAGTGAPPKKGGNATRKNINKKILKKQRKQ